MRRVVEWNGRDVPEGLRELPPGRYEVVVDDAAGPDAVARPGDEQQSLRRLAARVADARCCD